MSKKKRPLLHRVVLSALFVAAGLMGLLFFTQTPMLDPLQQQACKQGKLFWDWKTPEGDWTVHYTEHGEGSNHLLLIHGFRANTFTWRHLVTPLAEAGYHVWTIDLIGYGLSDKPKAASYDVPLFVQQLKAFMEARNIPSAHLVGNSMGGGLALSLALDHPQKVRSLTLISALGYPFDLPFYLSLTKHLGPLWVPFVGPAIIRSGLKQIVFDAKTVTDEQVEAYSLPYRFPGGADASLMTLKQFDKQKLADLSVRYDALFQPLLIIWGDHDNLIPVTHYEKFLSDFPSADRLLIPDCGHIPQEEKPELVVEAMIRFLKRQALFDEKFETSALIAEME